MECKPGNRLKSAAGGLMEILLTRHGSIFCPKDKVLVAGQGLDLHLTEEGGNQAENFAKALYNQGIFPDAVITSSLCRMQRYGEIIMEKIGIPGEPIIDERLTDLDYGSWTGRTEADIQLEHGHDVYTAWVDHGRWPQNAPWKSREENIREEVRSFCEDLAKFYDKDDVVVVITSNGRMKYFLSMVKGAFEEHSLRGTCRMRTGHVGKLVYGDKKFRLGYWNMNPVETTRLCDKQGEWNYAVAG